MNFSKTILFFSLLLIFNTLYSQNKKITGKVYETYTDFSGDNPFEEKIREAQNFKIYLLKSNVTDASGKLLLHSTSSDFEIIVSEKYLKKYKFLEFKNKNSSKIVEIETINTEPIEVVLYPEIVIKKPVIYLYPTQKQEITIIHNFKGKIINTYPKYHNNWSVIAEPNGNLTNKVDNRKYKYLFWDGIISFPKEHFDFREGFQVKKENTVEFLENKLASIGLNDSEINDFIVYWLPALNENGNNLIRFGINDNIFNTSFLEINPKPDTEIRVFMEFKKWNVSDNEELPEQILSKIERKGFTMVEWGGSQIKSDKIE